MSSSSVCMDVGDNKHLTNVSCLSHTHIRLHSLTPSSYVDVDPDVDTPFVKFHQTRNLQGRVLFALYDVYHYQVIFRTIAFLINIVVYSMILTTKHIRIRIVSNGIQMWCDFSAFLTTIQKNYLHCING